MACVGEEHSGQATTLGLSDIFAARLSKRGWCAWVYCNEIDALMLLEIDVVGVEEKDETGEDLNTGGRLLLSSEGATTTGRNSPPTHSGIVVDEVRRQHPFLDEKVDGPVARAAVVPARVPLLIRSRSVVIVGIRSIIVADVLLRPQAPGGIAPRGEELSPFLRGRSVWLQTAVRPVHVHL